MTTIRAKKAFPWHIIFFLGPGLLIYLTVSVYPLLDTLRLSLYHEEYNGDLTFTGLSNFSKLLFDVVWSRPLLERHLE